MNNSDVKYDVSFGGSMETSAGTMYFKGVKKMTLNELIESARKPITITAANAMRHKNVDDRNKYAKMHDITLSTAPFNMASLTDDELIRMMKERGLNVVVETPKPEENPDPSA